VGFTVEAATDLTTINCGKCAGVYAISEKYRLQKYNEGGFWHCPYCEVSWGYGEGENTRLRRQAEAAKQREQWANGRADDWRKRAEHEERRARAARGQVTKIKKRVGNGVCPCCTRSFANLQRHMSAQHPDWTPESDPST
jgi:hypothetical protein